VVAQADRVHPAYVVIMFEMTLFRGLSTILRDPSSAVFAARRLGTDSWIPFKRKRKFGVFVPGRAAGRRARRKPCLKGSGPRSARG